MQRTAKWRKFYKNLPQPRRRYAAFVSTVDERIGRLIDKVEKLGLTKNTIFVFQSDHGHSTESRGFGGGGSARIYRGAKFSLFEGGIRVPAIISWEGKLKKKTVIDQPAFEVDWLPTVAELCSIEHNIKNLNGKSLVKMINDPSTPSAHEHYIWQIGNSWAVRKGNWKLLGRPNDTSDKGKLDPVKDKLFLTNLKTDPTEMKNFAKEYLEKVDELNRIYTNWQYAKEP